MMELLNFICYMFQPRALRACWRMSSFDRHCWTVDWMRLESKARSERT